MKSKIIIIIIVVFALPLSAQVNVTSSLRVLSADFSSLNTQIGNTYPMLNNGMISIGVGYGYQLNRLGISFFGSRYTSFAKNTVPLKRTTFDGYGGSMKVDYAFRENHSFQIRPFLNFGLRKYRIILSESALYSITDILNQDIQNYKLNNGGMNFDFGIGIRQHFLIPHTVIAISLSAGYRVDSGEWKYNDINIIRDEIANTTGIMGMLGITMTRRKSENVEINTKEI